MLEAKLPDIRTHASSQVGITLVLALVLSLLASAVLLPRYSHIQTDAVIDWRHNLGNVSSRLAVAAAASGSAKVPAVLYLQPTSDSCRFAKGDWCQVWKRRKWIPWAPPPRGDKGCLWNCNGVGVRSVAFSAVYCLSCIPKELSVFMPYLDEKLHYFLHCRFVMLWRAGAVARPAGPATRATSECGGRVASAGAPTGLSRMMSR